RTFLNNVVGSTIVMDGDAIINQYAGGYDDYLVQKQQQVSVQKSKNKPIKISKPLQSKKLSYKEQRELDKIPEKIEQLELQIGEIQLQLADPEFFAKEESQDELIRLAKLEFDLEILYEKWSELE
ncbi:MAG TPA: ABC transporter ATP-binding protein, partial [Gammaproteobacteria bacterium]|nr:ABC transporter ATP-binding protein [Gammaproteobacteria bacterium]